MMQSAYLCVILDIKHKKLPFLAVLTWFLIRCKIQDGGHCWWRHRPPGAPAPIKYNSSCREDQRLSTEVEIVSKYCNILKILGRGSNTPRLVLATVGVWICVHPRVKRVVRINCDALSRVQLMYVLTVFRISSIMFLALCTCSAVPRKWARVSLMNIWTPHSSLISFSLLPWRPITSPTFSGGISIRSSWSAKADIELSYQLDWPLGLLCRPRNLDMTENIEKSLRSIVTVARSCCSSLTECNQF